MMNVRISRIDPSLPLPRYESQGAVGFDLITRQEITIAPGRIGFIPANVVVAVPKGYALLIIPRSSLSRRKSLVCPHSIGVIDQDYCGADDEVQVQVMNVGKEEVTVERGERIAQGILVRVEQAQWEEVEEHGVETRGGFGSTGTHS